MTSREKWLSQQEKLEMFPLSIRLRPSVHAQITKLASDYNVSKNAVINDLLLDALNLLQAEYKLNTDNNKLIIL